MSLVLAKDSGIDTSIQHVKSNEVNTTFRLIGEEADISAMTDIVMKQPDSVYTVPYTDGWVKRRRDGEDIVLNADNREQSAYACGMVLFDKTADENVGVVWDKA